MFNQGAINPETQSYRIAMVPGGITHPVLGALPDIGSLPVPLAGTGTVTTNNTDPTGGTFVTGVGTTFKNDPNGPGPGKIHGEIFPGDYLAVNSAGQFLRRITKVLSDTQLVIEAKFPSSLSGNFYIVRKNPYKMIAARGIGSVASQLQEQSFATNETFSNGGSPVTYNCQNTNNAINFQIDY